MYLIIGDGKSGKALGKFFEKNNEDFAIFDDAKDKIKDFSNKIGNFEKIIISPAIKLDHPLVALAKSKNIDVVGEIEYTYSQIKKNKPQIIALTGTNGKTTTVRLMGKIFGDTAYLAGNIGEPWISYVDESRIAVLELSSFQLTTTKTFHANISVLLNLAPDHIEWHGDYRSYYESKLRIFDNQDENDFSVLNADDELIVKETEKIKSQKYYFSLKSTCKGCYIKNKWLVFKDKKPEKVCKVKNINLIGDHNLQNVMAAICVAKICNVSNKDICQAIENFKPDRHRIETTIISKVRVVDDSKATNVDAAVVAKRCFNKNVIWLLGGSDKGECFDRLFENTIGVKKMIFFGGTKEMFISSAKRMNYFNYIVAKDLLAATRAASALAKKGDVVLLSPACASFDEFTGYDKRGEKFVENMQNLLNEENKDEVNVLYEGSKK